LFAAVPAACTMAAFHNTRLALSMQFLLVVARFVSGKLLTTGSEPTAGATEPPEP
jgi:hypothetical protein